MNRRIFLKTIGIIWVASQSTQYGKQIIYQVSRIGRQLKNWAWITTDTVTTKDEWKRSFYRLREAGIHAILPEVFNGSFAFYNSDHLTVKDLWLDRILPIAKAEGLEIHAWIWTMICNMDLIMDEHPDWYIVNGKGESILKKPAYTDWYKFLCPSHKGGQDFIAKRVKELSEYSELDGIHLDYIRYPEVIIAPSLQKKYNIVQDREYPEYDYCYCDVCRKSFKQKYGIDPLKLSDPTSNAEWKQFRFDSITNFINNKLVPIAKGKNKILTAAVFPPHNRDYVRQQWYNWNIDAYLPMNYNNFYDKGIDWIKEQTEIEKSTLKNGKPIYSGLFVPQLNQQDFPKAIEASLEGGADGIVFFPGNNLNEEQLKDLKETKMKFE